MDKWASLDCSVQDALKDILADKGFKNTTNINVGKGSESGDGYASKTYAITLIDDGKKLELFVKYFPIDAVQKNGVITKLFNNEEMFYSSIYPALVKFQSDKNIKEPFNNVPNYFRIKSTRGVKPVVLENLKVKGYDLRERQHQIDEEHLNLTLKTFGKLHAVTFALKDQEFGTFQRITENITDVLAEVMVESGFDKVLETCINQFIDNLHPMHDKDILKSTGGLAKYLVEFVKDIAKYQGEYSTILQGDCWSNNMMYLYKNSKKPLDIKLIDWQLVRVNNPVFDLSYFFYTIATSEMLENWEHHMRVYHKYFREFCLKLGSDPNRLYPFEVLKDHWKKYSRYGLAMSFLLVKVMLYEKDEAPDLAKALESDTIDANLFNNKTRHQDVYEKRMKDILKHFIDNKFI